MLATPGRIRGLYGDPFLPHRSTSDLELAVHDKDGHHALVFPCRRIPGGWMHAKSKRWIDVSPTHWCEWVEKL
jgi:hypothetical protein